VLVNLADQLLPPHPRSDTDSGGDVIGLMDRRSG